MIKLKSLILDTIILQYIKWTKEDIFCGLEHSVVLSTLPLSGSLNR